MTSRVTIADIAREAGLSKGAVSYALNGKPGVSTKTRDQVVAIADRLGWRASQAARSLSMARAEAVGLVLTRPAQLLGVEPFYMEFIAGIEGVLAGRGMALLLHLAENVDMEVELYRRWWAQGRVDGVIVVDPLGEDPRISALIEIGIPAVHVRNPDDRNAGVQLWNDDEAAMREATRYLIRLGHRRIARVAGISGFTHIATRNAVLRAVASEHGLPAPVIVETDFTGEMGARATRGLLSSAEPPTAIIYDNDVMAVASLGVAAELDVTVPGELSLLAWDDSGLCQITHPPLSAMHRDVIGLGALAAEMLIQVIEGMPVPSRPAPASSLFVRGSTGRPPRL